MDDSKVEDNVERRAYNTHSEAIYHFHFLQISGDSKLFSLGDNKYEQNLIRETLLRYLVSFFQFKKREKRPWKSDTFSNVVGLSLQLY